MKLNYDVLTKFEKVISDYTGAPFVVLTDSCTHAIEICLRRTTESILYYIPKRTYLSVPMLFSKLNLELSFFD